MPRRNGDPSAGDATRMARHRLLATLGTPLAGNPEGEELLPVAGQQASKERHNVLSPASGEGDVGENRDADAAWDAGPPGRPARTRWRVPWRVPALLIVPALLLAAWLAWQAWSGRPAPEELAPLEQSSAAAGGTEEPAILPPGQGTMVVHIAGAVKKPGIVKLPPGARVFEAIAAAGGAAPGAVLDGLNLAAVVQDGTKVQVPRQGEAPAAVQGAQGSPAGQAVPSLGTGGGGSGMPGGRININTASVQELDALPKVGPVLAQRIVDWRTEHGPFAAAEELDAVDGVGPKMLEALLPLVTI